MVLLTKQELEQRQFKRRRNAYERKCNKRLIRGWIIYGLAIIAVCGYSAYCCTKPISADEGVLITEPTTEIVQLADSTTITEESTEVTTAHIIQTSTEAITTTEATTIITTTTVDNDTYLLAQLIDAEAGDECSDEHKLWVGQVVLNRVKSPKFPNTLKEVIYQQQPCIQYACVANGSIDDIPSERSLKMAEILLSGFVVDDEVIWQSEYPQGEVVAALYNGYSMTYICK